MLDNLSLETILLSITTEATKDFIIDRLKETMLLDTSELELINEYERIFDETRKIPTPSLLANTNPQYQNMPIITNEDDLLQYVTMFIRTKLKTDVSSSIMNNIQQLTNSDIKTSDVVNNIINEANRLSIIDEEATKITTSIDGLELYNQVDLSDRYKTGLEPIDSVCGGIPEGSLTIIMGGTGSFKTMTTTNICYNAMTIGKNVCYISLEISKAHMYFNIASRHSVCGKFSLKLAHKSIKNKELDTNEENELKQVFEDIDKLEGKLSVIDETDIKSFDIAGFQEAIKQVDEIFNEKTGHGVDILVVDHAQLLKFNGNGKMSDPYMIVNYYVSWLRQQSLNFLRQGKPISVIVVSQTSRAGMEYAAKHGGHYLLTHAAEANELERAASYVIAVYADDATRGSNELMVQLLKSRNSETMQEPQTVKINPAYYQVGGDIQVESITPIFKGEDLFSNGKPEDLEQALNDIF